MKFSTVEIRERAAKRGAYVVSFSDLDGDRHNENFGPHGLGFYHYPRRKSRAQAFEELRAHMVRCCENDLTALTRKLNTLKALTLTSEA
jgi:hypothetical protein